MKVPTLVALLLAAATSTAMAQPHEEHGGRVQYGPKPPPVVEQVPRREAGTWVRLAAPTSTELGTVIFVVPKDANLFRTLRIDVRRGTVHLKRVRVQFVNGQSTNFQLEGFVTPRQVADIDLGTTRAIARVMITTARKPFGTYVVLASPQGVARPILVSQR